VFGMVVASNPLFFTKYLNGTILRFFFDFFTQLFTIVKYSYDRILSAIFTQQFWI
jgi:hypothetical protein